MVGWGWLRPALLRAPGRASPTSGPSGLIVIDVERWPWNCCVLRPPEGTSSLVLQATCQGPGLRLLGRRVWRSQGSGSVGLRPAGWPDAQAQALQPPRAPRALCPQAWSSSEPCQGGPFLLHSPRGGGSRPASRGSFRGQHVSAGFGGDPPSLSLVVTHGAVTSLCALTVFGPSAGGLDLH